MGQRGRKSAAEAQAAAQPASATVIDFRPAQKPPESLTPAQKLIWNEVMRTTARSLIAIEAFPVLVEYCRAIDTANQIAEMLAGFDRKWAKKKEGFERWSRLIAMQERTSSKVSSLAVKLRIAPSTRILPRGAGRAEARQLGAEGKPWEE